MAAAAVVGVVAALPALRLRADYLAIVTVALSEIIRLALLSSTFERFGVAGIALGTGGGQGLNLPTNPVRGLYYVEADNPGAGLTPLGEAAFGFFGELSVPLIAGSGVRPTVVIGWTYALVLVGVVLLYYWLLVRIGNSPFGRVLKAIREDELAANALGKDTDRFKVVAFAVGCALMGLAGILWQGSQGFVNPGNFMPLLTFFAFIALIVGGAGSNTGSVLGGMVFASLLFEGPTFLRRVMRHVAREGVSLGAAGMELSVGGGGLASPPNDFVGAVAPLGSLDAGPLIAYSLANLSSLRLVFLGVALVYLMQRRPRGMLGHRKEVAAAVDLSRRDPRGGEEP
jgi:branched-chain amino acid transport system permease protein